jgi:hypothetical protein
VFDDQMDENRADYLRQEVKRERGRRAWSVRTAASNGGISNTAWGEYEKVGALTNGTQAAIAKAFGWPVNWPETLEPGERPATPQVLGEDSQSSELTTLLASLDRTVKRLEERLERLEHPDASQSPIDPPVANGTDRPLKRPRRSS